MAERIDSVLSRQLQSQLISQLKGPEVEELVDELTRSLAEDISRQVRELAIVPTSPLQKLKKRLEFQINSQLERDRCQQILRKFK